MIKFGDFKNFPNLKKDGKEEEFDDHDYEEMDDYDDYVDADAGYYDDMEYYDEDDEEEYEPAGHLQSRFPFLACNHSFEKADKYNYGYTYGVTGDEIPFEAELWEDNGYLNITFYMPEIEEFNELEEEPLLDESSGADVYRREEKRNYNMILVDNMIDRGMIGSVTVLNAYVELLIESTLVSFRTDMLNGAGMLLTDLAGNDIVALIVTIEDHGEKIADTPLDFLPFHPDEKVKRKNFRLV